MQKVIAVVGPTAVGKTALGIEIAQAVQGEVISADSRQVYRGLDIGTGKVTLDETKGILHHLIDVADPREVFTASDFVQLGRVAISEISSRHHIPIVVGGTGFYVDTLLGRMTPASVPPNQAVRDELSAFSLEELQKEMKKLDPERYEKIDIKNRRRLERAIEIARLNPGSWKLKVESAYDTLWLGLTLPLLELQQRIHRRLLARLNAGMLDEARSLLSRGLTLRRMEELGLEYRYIARYLQGKILYDDMRVQLEKEIVAYAKRQMTWFKKNKKIRWFRPDEHREATQYVLDSLRTGP